MLLLSKIIFILALANTFKFMAMKKIFGILFLIIGLVMLVIGGGIIVSNESKDTTIEGQVKEAFSEQYRADRERNLNNGRILLAAGLIFFVGGTSIVVTKSKTHKKKAAYSEWKEIPQKS